MLPGVGPPVSSLTATVIFSATKTSSTHTSFDPVPHRPVAFQVSLILYSLLLSRKIRYSMPSASSSDETTLASMFQSQDSTPDENCQWPFNRYPPSTFVAQPAAKRKEDAINASASLLQTASCACRSNMPSIQWWLAR